MEEEMTKGRKIPAFGQWDYCNDLPITQYFESAWPAGLIRGHFCEEDGDLSKVPAPAKPAYHHHQKVTKVVAGEKQRWKEQQRKQGRVCDATTQVTPRRPRSPKAVDEDLYKISPDLLHQKPKRKRLLRNLVSGCLSFNCVP